MSTIVTISCPQTLEAQVAAAIEALAADHEEVQFGGHLKNGESSAVTASVEDLKSGGAAIVDCLRERDLLDETHVYAYDAASRRTTALSV